MDGQDGIVERLGNDAMLGRVAEAVAVFPRQAEVVDVATWIAPG